MANHNISEGKGPNDPLEEMRHAATADGEQRFTTNLEDGTPVQGSYDKHIAAFGSKILRRFWEEAA